MKNICLLIVTLCIVSSSYSQLYTNDPSFNVGSGVSFYSGFTPGITYDIKYHPDSNRIFVLGGFNYYDNQSRNNLVLINSDGIIDNSFIPDSTLCEGVSTMAVQIDGKVVIANIYNSINRLLSNGQQDLSFDASSLGLMGYVKKIVVQTDGKILIGGSINFLNNSSVLVNSIVRLNSDGSQDITFNAPASTGAFNVNDLALQSDGKIIICGSFSDFTGSGYNNAIRLNSDGSLDNSFTNNFGPNGGFNTLEIYQNNDILLSGTIVEDTNNQTISSTIRLNSNGTVDPNFNYPTPIIEPYDILIQDDGKIIICGLSDKCIIRLNSNGEIDSTFSLFYGANERILCALQDSEDNIIIGGDFETFNKVTKNGITKISTDCSLNVIPFYYYANGVVTYPGSNQISNISPSVNTFGFENAFGCDSLIEIHVNPVTFHNHFYSIPTSDSICNGKLSIKPIGAPSFYYNIGNGSPQTVDTTNAYFYDLCEGFYSIDYSDGNGGSNSQFFVIPDYNSYIFNNIFPYLTPVDSAGSTIELCNIDYSSITSVDIDSVFYMDYMGSPIVGEVLALWSIYDSNGRHQLITNYSYMNQVGSNLLQLSFFCPNKSSTDFYSATQSIYFDGTNVSTTSIIDKKPLQFGLYPNPTSNSVTITFVSNSTAHIQILDANGKFIQENSIVSGQSISLEELERGIYFISLEIDNQQYIERIIKQ